ncbi:uncharacterized protein KZ484_018808 isoform 1-T1 [Pholidichthys leucotaenia]
MMNFFLIPALLCTLIWITISDSVFRIAEVHPGGDVTLLCSNFTSLISHIYWFKLNRVNATCITSLQSSYSNVSFCDGFKGDKFKMTSNTSVLFLRIEPVNFSDSGLYFCGEYCSRNRKPVISSATYLKVQEVSGSVHVTTFILGTIIILLVTVVIVLIVRIKKFHTAQGGGNILQCSENMGDDALTYAALNFQTKRKMRRPEPNVVNTATR